MTAADTARRDAFERARILYMAGGKSLAEIAREPGVIGIVSHDALKRRSRAEGWARARAGEREPIRLDLDACADDPATLASAVRAAIRAILDDPAKARVGDMIAAAEWLESRAQADRSRRADFSRFSDTQADAFRAMLEAATAGRKPVLPVEVERYSHDPLSIAEAENAALRASTSAAAVEAAEARAQAAEAGARAAEAERDAARAAEAEARAGYARIMGTVAAGLAEPIDLPD